MSLIIKSTITKCSSGVTYIPIRHSRNKPFIPILKKTFQPQLYYSLKERLAETDKSLNDTELYRRHNIGFQYDVNFKVSKRRDVVKDIKSNYDLERAAKNNKLRIDLDDVENEWNRLERPLYLKALADNCGIFQDLFGDYSFFYPVVHLDISYDYDDDTISPVFAGNLLKPMETSTAPTVNICSKSDELWTLILTNPDGNLYEDGSEVMHWFVGNIPGGKMESGEIITEYLQPLPPKGTGFHRFCFLLYKQTEKLDFSKYKTQTSSLNLKERTFSTQNFYSEFEDRLTPAGLSWFMADYDNSLKNVFHNVLEMKEPIYEYEFPKPYVAPQRHFPHLKPFNRYMDLHRDPKEMQKLMLLKRLARIHPLKGEPELLPFPQCVPIEPNDLPVWLKNEIREERDGKGKYRDVYRGDDRPFIEEGKRKSFPFSNLK